MPSWRNRSAQIVRRTALAATSVIALAALSSLAPAPAIAGPLETPPAGSWRVLPPIHSGSLTLFPVVRTAGAAKPDWPYITLDEGLKSGEVEITEAGRARGLVRDPMVVHPQPVQPGPSPWPRPRTLPHPPGDAVNTLILINRSGRPLLLLAGEIVTGGRQDRVIGKDRIVPADSDPIDLSVFCIEPGRWVESSPKFAPVGSGVHSFMVQPSVRSQVVVSQNQRQVWTALHGSVDALAGSSVQNGAAPLAPATSSYAKAMQDESISRKVDAVSEPLTGSHREALEKLREEHAVGVVAAVNGRILWADIFADTDLLAAYWDKLVRSYAAESLDSSSAPAAAQTAEPTLSDAQHFIDAPARGTETSEGETGIYRYTETRGDSMATFTLHALLPGTDFDVHISRAAVHDLVPVSVLQLPRPVPIRPEGPRFLYPGAP
jgi:hypothetical protein